MQADALPDIAIQRRAPDQRAQRFGVIWLIRQRLNTFCLCTRCTVQRGFITANDDAIGADQIGGRS